MPSNISVFILAMSLAYGPAGTTLLNIIADFPKDTE